MAIFKGKFSEHELIITSTRKFNILFGELQKQKKDTTASASFEEFFLLELELINSYFQQLLHDAETISQAQPDILILDSVEIEGKRNELIDIARLQLLEVLNNYNNIDLARILKSATISTFESYF